MITSPTIIQLESQRAATDSLTRRTEIDREIKGLRRELLSQVKVRLEELKRRNGQ